MTDNEKNIPISNLPSDEAQETLRAIRDGEIDALVVAAPDGEKVYTLTGAERPYRVFVENMTEGAVTLSPDGAILYANRRFAEMVHLPVEYVIGSSILPLFGSADRHAFQASAPPPNPPKPPNASSNSPTTPPFPSTSPPVPSRPKPSTPSPSSSPT